MGFFRHLPAMAVAGIAFSALVATANFAAAGERGPTLVELFTSQGCAACPPADRLLSRLALRDDILALSFHVDYWDYIGWRDPFASAANSQRQPAYAATFNQSYVYTPQMIIHGIVETTGSDEDSVDAGIEKASAVPDIPIELTLEESGDLTITIEGAAQVGPAAVWLAIFDPRQTTRVRRGENRGKTIENVNVVRRFTKIGDWNGAAVTLTVPASVLKEHKGRSCAVFLQREAKGPVLGAAAINLAQPQR